MGSGRNITRRVALGSIVAGSVMYVLNTYSFTMAEANRSAAVDSAADPDALLGITGKTAETTPAFENNFNSQLELTLTAPNESSAEFDVDDDGSNLASSVTFTLDPGQTRNVGMSADVAEITVEVDGTFSTGTIDLARDFEIPQAQQVDITATVKSAGNSGKFEFGLANTGSIDAVMDSIRVDSTSTSATRVRDGSIFSVTDSEDQNESTRQLIASPLTIGASEPLTQFTATGSQDTVTLRSNNTDGQPGPETTFEFDRFQAPKNGGYTNAKMKGAQLTITIGFDDGSSRQYVLDDS